MEGLSEDKDTAAGSEDDLVDRVYLYLKDNAYPMQSSATNLVEAVKYIQNPAERRNITLASQVHSTSGYLGVKKTSERKIYEERFCGLHSSTPGLQYTTLGSNLSFDVMKDNFA
eukprot:Em0537g2a